MGKGKDYRYHLRVRVLPDEIIAEILSWVPASCLLRFRCVCKSWSCLIDNPDFVKLHVTRAIESNSNNSYILESFASQYRLHNHIFSWTFASNCEYSSYGYHPFEHFTRLSDPDEGIFKAKPLTSAVVGLCHGLVCFEYVFQRGIYNQYLIYNPTTRASKLLPELGFTRGYTCILGFGYDSDSHDYKVLSTSKFNRLDDFKVGTPQRSMLYSLKTNSWETVDNPPWNVTLINFRSPAFVNNSFHWLHCEGKEIKCFSLSTRSYYEIPLPERMFSRPEKLCRNFSRMTEFKGQLCVVNSYFDIWILKEYGWTQVFRNNESLLIVSFHGGLSTIDVRVACLEANNNFILIVTSCCYGGSPVLCFYCDVARGTTEEIEMPSFPAKMGLAALQPWVESLVPLH